MPPIIPSTLQAARLSRGLSLSALAQLCGVSAPTLNRLEKGIREGTPFEAEAIAQAVGLPVAALSRSLVSDRLGLSGFYHRKLSRAGAKSVARIENQCVLDVVAISELIGMVGLGCAENVPVIHRDEVRGDPEKAADMVRLSWRVARGPILNIFSVVENAGCLVIHSDFGIPEMDAMYQKVRGCPPIFWVNSRKPLERVRFSVAHELGHLVLHEEDPIDEKKAEDEANAFAAAFLMPAGDFRGECPARIGIAQLVELKRRWRCSMSAIARSAARVRRITEQQLTYLQVELSRRGWRTQEPYPVTGESPTLLASIVQRCLRECSLTEEGLAERLAIPVAQVRAWQQPFPGQKPIADREPSLRFVDGY